MCNVCVFSKMIASNKLDLFEAACQIIFLPKLHWTSKLDDKIGHVNKPLLAWSACGEEKKFLKLSPVVTDEHLRSQRHKTFCNIYSQSAVINSSVLFC
jgi:hypothetical protein